jgi:hypothetical protein
MGQLSNEVSMRNLLILIAFIAGAYGLFESREVVLPGLAEATNSSKQNSGEQNGSEQILEDAFENQRSNLQVEGQGIVTRILTDDLDGSRHQRFIIRLNSGQTLLIAHNIDLAPRINALQEGDTVIFYGEYEWNPEGGVIHWTHHDPDGLHVDGWLKHNGQMYQ